MILDEPWYFYVLLPCCHVFALGCFHGIQQLEPLTAFPKTTTIWGLWQGNPKAFIWEVRISIFFRFVSWHIWCFHPQLRSIRKVLLVEIRTVLLVEILNRATVRPAYSSCFVGWIWLNSTFSGWWFGTFFIFPYIGNTHPNWLIFLRGVQTTNQSCFVGWIWLNSTFWVVFSHIESQYLHAKHLPIFSRDTKNMTRLSRCPTQDDESGARQRCRHGKTWESTWSTKHSLCRIHHILFWRFLFTPFRCLSRPSTFRFFEAHVSLKYPETRIDVAASPEAGSQAYKADGVRHRRWKFWWVAEFLSCWWYYTLQISHGTNVTGAQPWQFPRKSSSPYFLVLLDVEGACDQRGKLLREDWSYLVYCWDSWLTSTRATNMIKK